jgi:hypothetical protein
VRQQLAEGSGILVSQRACLEPDGGGEGRQD